MTENTVEVKLKGKVVATVKVPSYDTLEDLMANVAEDKILSGFNRQNKADITNAARAEHRGPTAGKQKRRDMAFNLVFASDPNKLLEFAGDAGKLRDYLESAEVQALVDAKLAESD